MKTVSDIFKRKGKNNITVMPDTFVLEALKIMAEKNIGSVVVMDNDKYCKPKWCGITNVPSPPSLSR